MSRFWRYTGNTWHFRYLLHYT